MESSGFSKIMYHYLQRCNGNVHLLGNANMLHATIQDYMKNITDFERPDAYAIVDDAVCIIEHFEFDSTKTTAKGSKSKIDLNRIERTFNKVEPTDVGVTLHDSLNVSHSAQNYINNALQNTKSHYSKIDSYVNNLRNQSIINDNSKLEVGFFIEDTTLLGNVYVPKESDYPRPIILAQCKQFLDLFENLPRLDFCFCASTYSSNYFLWFINRTSIQFYRESQIDLHDITIIDFRPQALGHKILIASELFENDPQGSNLQD